MTLLLGLFALLGLWWLSKNTKGLGSTLRSPAVRRLAGRLGGWAATALATFLLMRGQIALALLVGAGAVWTMEGRDGLIRRWRGLVPRRRPAAPQAIRFDLLPDGRIGDGTVLVGPLAGRKLSDLPRRTLLQVLAVCRHGEPDAALRLEAYLDGWHAGWRVDAEADPDPRPGRPPEPGAMTQQEAYEILGLQGGASLEEIRTAHRTLMKRMHPDQGGTVEQAARVNAARDRLTNRHR